MIIQQNYLNLIAPLCSRTAAVPWAILGSPSDTTLTLSSRRFGDKINEVSEASPIENSTSDERLSCRPR